MCHGDLAATGAALMEAAYAALPAAEAQSLAELRAVVSADPDAQPTPEQDAALAVWDRNY
jgi:hypothetical protein